MTRLNQTNSFEDTDGITRIGFELLDLLIAYRVHRQWSSRLVAGDEHISALEAREITHALWQDLVLRLCRLGERHRKSWNIEEAIKLYRSRRK